jgi:adenine/guanine phosphoribosyltransferase-like PRPP-binding protein
MQLTTVARMKNHPDYNAAKSGDTKAAFRLVDAMLSGENQKRKIAELAKKNPDAILVAAHAEEKKGRNKIPYALMVAISKITGMEYNNTVVQTNKVGRTGSDRTHRLAYRPKFDGTVKSGRKYILIDDVITGGGTLSELRCFVENNGGKVENFVTAGAAQFSTNIALSAETQLKLESKYGIPQLEKFLKEQNIYGGKIEYLTESEGKSLLAASSLNVIRERIAKARNEKNTQDIQRALSKGSSNKER